jgi:hypothetical protein
VLDLVVELDPCRVEAVGSRLLRVRGGSRLPSVWSMWSLYSFPAERVLLLIEIRPNKFPCSLCVRMVIQPKMKSKSQSRSSG